MGNWLRAFVAVVNHATMSPFISAPWLPKILQEVAEEPAAAPSESTEIVPEGHPGQSRVVELISTSVRAGLLVWSWQGM